VCDTVSSGSDWPSPKSRVVTPIDDHASSGATENETGTPSRTPTGTPTGTPTVPEAGRKARPARACDVVRGGDDVLGA
jgi:hypothetical protein